MFFAINRIGELTQLKNRFCLCFVLLKSVLKGCIFHLFHPTCTNLRVWASAWGQGTTRLSLSDTSLASIHVHGIRVLWILKLSNLAIDMQSLVCFNCIHSKNVMDWSGNPQINKSPLMFIRVTSSQFDDFLMWLPSLTTDTCATLSLRVTVINMIPVSTNNQIIQSSQL